MFWICTKKWVSKFLLFNFSKIFLGRNNENAEDDTINSTTKVIRDTKYIVTYNAFDLAWQNVTMSTISTVSSWINFEKLAENRIIKRQCSFAPETFSILNLLDYSKSKCFFARCDSLHEIQLALVESVIQTNYINSSVNSTHHYQKEFHHAWISSWILSVITQMFETISFLKRL